MELDDAIHQEITRTLEANEVVLFMKGSRQAPQCGFSATVVGILDSMLGNYHTVDVLSAPEIREGIKIFSSWPTIPQLYVKGEFIGGCDIIQEMMGSGELHDALGVEPIEIVEPNLIVTPTAAQALVQAAAEHGGGGRELHLSVDGTFQAHLSIAPRKPSDVAAIIQDNAANLVILLDPMSATRAEGITIDVADTPDGMAFRVDNPNAPRVQSMSVRELKGLIDAGESFELLDVRTPEERAVAAIPGAVLLNEAEAARIQALPKETRLVLHCHHGGRSQQAAEQFVSLGFQQVYNVVGGIDAWSQEIDADVPRY